MSTDKTSTSLDKDPGKSPGGKGDDGKASLGKIPAPVDAPAAADGAVTAVDPRLLVREQGFAGYLSEFGRKMRAA